MFKRNIIVGVLLGSSALYASAENKLSAEILLGMANQEISTSDASPSGDDISIGFRGAMSLHKNISAEISYHNYGEADDIHIDGFGDTINSKWTTTAFNLGAKGIFPLDNGVSLNARLGISIWDTELKFTDSSIPGQEFKVEDDGTDLYYGIGAEYDINSNMYVGAEYTLTKMNISADDSDVNNLSLSLGYKF